MAIPSVVYFACRAIAEKNARRDGSPGVSEADIEEVWIRAGSRIDDEIMATMKGSSHMNNSEIARQGFASIDLEDEGSFEFLLQQMQKLYSEIPDDKKSTAKMTFTDGWSGKHLMVTLP